MEREARNDFLLLITILLGLEPPSVNGHIAKQLRNYIPGFLCTVVTMGPGFSPWEASTSVIWDVVDTVSWWHPQPLHPDIHICV